MAASRSHHAVAATLPDTPQPTQMTPVHREGKPGEEAWRAMERPPRPRLIMPSPIRKELQPLVRPACKHLHQYHRPIFTAWCAFIHSDTATAFCDFHSASWANHAMHVISDTKRPIKQRKNSKNAVQLARKWKNRTSTADKAPGDLMRGRRVCGWRRCTLLPQPCNHLKSQCKTISIFIHLFDWYSTNGWQPYKEMIHTINHSWVCYSPFRFSLIPESRRSCFNVVSNRLQHLR